MKAKTVFIIILTALVTIILMKNADEVEFWIFGVYMVPKLAVLGTMFVIGVIVGLMLGRSKKKPVQETQSNAGYSEDYVDPTSYRSTTSTLDGTTTNTLNTPRSGDSGLSQEDSDYIR